jgi:hypothetical protein
MGKASINANAVSVVAHNKELHAALRPFASLVEEAVKAKIAPHSNTGEFEESIGVEEGRVDWYIVSNDPNAYSKEFGHYWNDDPGGKRTEGVKAFTRVAGGEL